MFGGFLVGGVVHFRCGVAPPRTRWVFHRRTIFLPIGGFGQEPKRIDDPSGQDQTTPKHLPQPSSSLSEPLPLPSSSVSIRLSDCQHSTMAPRRPQNQTRCLCCSHTCCILLTLAVVIGGGIAGVVVWRYGLPEDITGSRAPTPPSPAPSPAPSVTPFQFNQCTSEADCCNGLDNICDLRASEILYATMHNANADRQSGTNIFPNHNLPLEDALEAGYRGLAIDICKCNGVVVLCHGFCAIGRRSIEEVFANIVTFLEANPTEVVVMPTQITNSADEPVDLFQVYNILQTVSNVTNMMYDHGGAAEWPTLRTLKETNRVCVVVGVCLGVYLGSCQMLGVESMTLAQSWEKQPTRQVPGMLRSLSKLFATRPTSSSSHIVIVAHSFRHSVPLYSVFYSSIMRDLPVSTPESAHRGSTIGFNMPPRQSLYSTALATLRTLPVLVKSPVEPAVRVTFLGSTIFSGFQRNEPPGL